MAPTRLPRRALLGLWGGLVAALLLVPASHPAGAQDEPTARVGVGALDPLDPVDREAPRIQRLEGLGRLLAKTVPVRWDQLEPEAPTQGRPDYAWTLLDEAIFIWQLAGLDPVLVLSPQSAWASVPRAQSAWVKELAGALSPAEAGAARRVATGAAPPKSQAWSMWARFVRDVVERYDGDGQADMPLLRRPVRHIQVVDDAASPASWVGSPEQYLKLLHHAGVGAREASADVRLVASTLDVQVMGHDPYPDLREWTYRTEASLPRDPECAHGRPAALRAPRSAPRSAAALRCAPAARRAAPRR